MSNTTLKPPTAKQLRYLRTLAQRTGTTFTAPTTTREASLEINRMRRLASTGDLPDHRNPPSYATAPVDTEITGYGIRAHWRHTPPPKQQNPGGSADPPTPTRRARATILANHTENGEPRQILSIPCGSSRLIVDRVTAGGDSRLLARLTPDEPAENARLIARMYLEDPRPNKCRPVLREDLHATPPQRASVPGPSVAWRAPLIAGVGATFRLQPVEEGRLSALRWTEHAAATNGTPKPVALRHVIATLEDYQPALAMSQSAIAAESSDPHCSVATLRGEVARLTASSIVLNRRLREHVQRAVEGKQTTMSEIALRCGHSKRSATGRESGETSWLARRIGILPEAGAPRATPWVHIDVLAVIARDGLGISPAEVEMH